MPGCPIQWSPDITLMCSSPRLIAAYHDFLRLLMPRHSPCALSSLTFVGAKSALFGPPFGQPSSAPLLLLSNLNPLTLGFKFVTGDERRKSFSSLPTLVIRKVQLRYWFSVFLIRIMQALPKEVLLWLIVITLIKSFLLLPSHNCIIIKNNVQFSRYILLTWRQNSTLKYIKCWVPMSLHRASDFRKPQA